MASAKQVYSGDPVEFSCTARMANPDFPDVNMLSGARLPSHDIDEVLIDEYTYRTEMWIYTQKELKEEYACRVEYHLEDKVMKLEKTLTIYSYSKYVRCMWNLQ